ncbi:MAG: hypothetical protein M0C28_13125 [Candidatus Moduliflexus flocculans]|nr:hypothetical protein [Candidatus Moduliflexus flocculans]
MEAAHAPPAGNPAAPAVPVRRPGRRGVGDADRRSPAPPGGGVPRAVRHHRPAVQRAAHPPGGGPDGLPTLEVGARMVEETPGITRLLDRLEAKGLVRRQRCPEGPAPALSAGSPGRGSICCARSTGPS